MIPVDRARSPGDVALGDDGGRLRGRRCRRARGLEVIIGQMGYPFKDGAAVNAALGVFARTARRSFNGKRLHCEPDGRRGDLTGFSLFENRDRGEVAGAAQPAAKSGNALLECLDWHSRQF